MRTIRITVNDVDGQQTYEVVNPRFADEETIRQSIADHKAGKRVLWVRTDPNDGTERFGAPTEKNLPMFR